MPLSVFYCLYVFLISCLNINESLREPSLCIAMQIVTTFAQKLSISVNYIIKETLIFTQLKTIVFFYSNVNLVPSRLSKRKFHLPWITKRVRKQIKSRDKLYVKAVKSKSTQNWKRCQIKVETEYLPMSPHLQI